MVFKTKHQPTIDHLQMSWLLGQVRGRCLHVGCGEKYIAGVVNIDPNEGRRRVDERWNVCALPCEDGSFDSIISCHVLPSLQDFDAAMSEMARVLKPGGVMAHVVPDWRYAPERLCERHPWEYQHQGWYGPDEFARAIEPYLDQLHVVELACFLEFDWAFKFRAIRL